MPLSPQELKDKILRRLDGLLGMTIMVRGEDRAMLSALRGYAVEMNEDELNRLLKHYVEPRKGEAVAITHDEGWKPGPLPPDTYGWGGVVPTDKEDDGFFYYADFCGDHVCMCPEDRTLKPEEVKWYNNAIQTCPPGCEGRADAGEKGKVP